MGVIHKLKPEVLNFILENKQNNPGMSCRHLTSLIFEQLQIKVSKSSVNAVFKENALSMPIGRRAKGKKKKFKMPVLPVIEEKNRLGSMPLELPEKADAAPVEKKDDQLKEKRAQDAQAIQQEQKRLDQEKAAQDAAQLKAKEEERLKETARLAKEAQAKQEEARRAAEEKAAQEARIKALEEAAKAAEEKRKLEEARARELEEARKREQEKAAKEEEEKRRIEEIARKVAEEKAAQELARIKAAEEARMQELEKAAQELARMKAQEEERLKELERLAQEAAETKRRQEEALRLEQERIAQEEARIKALEDARLRELEKAVREAEEKRKQQEEARRAAEEKAAQEAARVKEIERLAQEAEAKRKLEEEHKLEEQRVQDAARIKELERMAKEFQAKQEEERRLAEEKVREAELKAEKEKWARLAEQEQKAKQAPEPAAVQPAPAPEPPQPDSQVPQVLPEERVCSGAMVLKTLDNLSGVSRSIGELVNRATGIDPEQAHLMTQALIFRSLFVKDTYAALGDLIGVRYSQEKLNAYYSQIKQIDEIGHETAKIISNAFTEAKGIKLHFTDGSVVNLDGQLYSSWPAVRFPFDFSNPVSELRKRLEKNFLSGSPLVLFSPPGYDIFPKDFFSLLLNFTSKEIRPDSLTLFGNQLEDLDTIPIEQRPAYSLIFGLWPWQFTSSRRVRKIGDFYLKYIKEIDRDLYLGEIEIDLFRASVNQSISLKGCAVKTDLKEKIRLVILSSALQTMGMDELAGMFLGRWPNFEEAFQDFSRKIELFTYAGGEQPFFPKDSFGLDNAGTMMDLAGILQNYLKMLDAYLRWHFLPNDYREKDLSATTDCFYKVPAKLISSEARLRVKTLVSQDYQYLRDLEYLNCRLNERGITTAGGKRMWFESAFK